MEKFSGLLNPSARNVLQLYLIHPSYKEKVKYYLKFVFVFIYLFCQGCLVLEDDHILELEAEMSATSNSEPFPAPRIFQTKIHTEWTPILLHTAQDPARGKRHGHPLMSAGETTLGAARRLVKIQEFLVIFVVNDNIERSDAVGT